MSVMKWVTPLEELDFFRKEMEGLLSNNTSANTGTFSPPVEVIETENNYQVRLLLPGLPAEQISEHVRLEATQKTLTLSGEINPRELQGSEKLLVNQFRYGKFFKQLSFPDGINHDHIEAAYKNGILEVSLPKTIAVQKRSIQIQAS